MIQPRTQTAETFFPSLSECCTKASGRSGQLVRHRYANNRRSCVCPCEGCGLSCTGSGQLRLHRRSHTGDRPFVCSHDSCGRAFADRSGLTKHQRSHSGDRPFVCSHDSCGRAFKQSGALARHSHIHTGEKPFACPYEGCGKVFGRQCHLTSHLRTHTKVRPYVCFREGCGRSFGYASELARHRRTHTGEKPFICSHEDCDRSFACPSDLTKHRRIHTGEKPFACSHEGCDRSFARSGDRAKHRRLHRAKTAFVYPHEGCGHVFRQQKKQTRQVSAHARKKSRPGWRARSTTRTVQASLPPGRQPAPSDSAPGSDCVAGGQPPLTTRGPRLPVPGLPMVAISSYLPPITAVVCPGVQTGAEQAVRDRRRIWRAGDKSWPATAALSGEDLFSAGSCMPPEAGALRSQRQDMFFEPLSHTGQCGGWVQPASTTQVFIPDWLRALADAYLTWPLQRAQGTDASDAEVVPLPLSNDDQAFWQTLMSPAASETGQAASW